MKMTFLNNLFFPFFVAMLVFHCSRALHPGTECKRSICNMERGFITYHSGGRSRWTLRTADRRYTTFVLLLRNVQGSSELVRWLRISQRRYTFLQNHDIVIKGDRLFVFEETDEVQISLVQFGIVHFKIDFFVGCEVSEGKDININKEPLKAVHANPAVEQNVNLPYYPRAAPSPNNFFYFNQFTGVPRSRYVQPAQPAVLPHSGNFEATSNRRQTTCWLVVPQITEEIYLTNAEAYYYFIRGIQPPTKRNVEVEQTYLTFQNVTMSNVSTLQATDLITGNTLMSSTGDDVISVSTLYKSENKSIIFQSAKTISSLIFVDLICENKPDCEQAGFVLASKALAESDVNCIEREQKCRFNIGYKQFNCTPPPFLPSQIFEVHKPTEEDLENSNCPAFSSFLENILSTVEAVPQEESDTVTDEFEGSGFENTTVTERGLSVGEQEKVKAKLYQCNNYQAYCAYKCGEFAKFGCGKICLLFKMNYNICAFFQPSIFS